MNNDKNLMVVSEMANRHPDQARMLYRLCDNDLARYTKLEQLLKFARTYAGIHWVPGSKDAVTELFELVEMGGLGFLPLTRVPQDPTSILLDDAVERSQKQYLDVAYSRYREDPCEFTEELFVRCMSHTSSTLTNVFDTYVRKRAYGRPAYHAFMTNLIDHYHAL